MTAHKFYCEAVFVWLVLMHAHAKRAHAHSSEPSKADVAGKRTQRGGLAASQRNALRVYLFRAARSLTLIICEGKRAKIKLNTKLNY